MADIKEDNIATKSKRDTLMEKLQAKYPDKEYADDEEMFGQINDDYDEYDNALSGYKDREGQLTELFNSDPESAQFITDWVRGKSPFVEMIRRIGKEGIMDLLEDPDSQEEFAKAHSDRLERIAKEKELEEQFKTNIGESLATLERVQQERGLSDEKMDAAYDLIGQIANDAILGKITEESIDMALKALNYDTDVEAAGAEGEVKGRNTKIEEKLRKPTQGDGMPMLDGANNKVSQRRNASIFDVASQA